MPITKATASSVAPAAKGDLVVGSATNDAAVLGVGSNDQVLTADSSTATGLKWATASSGGMTLLETLSLSGASVTSSTIAGTYKNLQIVVRNYKPATDAQPLRMRLNSDTGTSYRTFEAFAGGPDAANSTVLAFTQDSDNSVSNSLAIANITDYANSSTYKIAHFNTITTDSTTTTQVQTRFGYGVWYNTNAITTITFLPANGNFTSGSILIYGVS